jgi:transposase
MGDVQAALNGKLPLNGLDPEGYLRDVIARIAGHPISRIEELLPWNISALLAHETQLAA